MDFSVLLAIWGSVLSTILAALRLIEFRRDRPRIRVSLEEGRAVYSAERNYGNYSYVCITVSNRGSRPITVDYAGLILPRGSKLNFIFHVDYLQPITSHELSEGKAEAYFVKEEDIPGFQELRKKHRYTGCVVDVTGRRYYSDHLFDRILKLKRFGYTMGR